ncbi:MAG: tetratricopeptide repeat protein [Desulfovibrio sp.]|nr:tetratricopeptide repeat protein [Desulfovibrio sp.]
MRRPYNSLLCAILLLALCAFSLVGCGGCSGNHQKIKETKGLSEPAPEKSVSSPPQELHGVPLRPAENNLTPDALNTFAYLVFTQAIHHEDEQGLAAIIPLMVKARMPASVWLEGGVWLLSRKSPYASTVLDEALAMWPDDLSLNLLYAEILQEKDMPELGIARMRDYLEKHPDAIDARMEMALLLVKNKQYPEAEHIFDSIKGKQRTPLVDYYQARALIGMDKRNEAVPFLQRAIKGMPEFVEALTELALIYERKSDLKAAQDIYERLLKLNFSPQDVLLRLISTSLRLNQPERALRYLRKGPETPAFTIAVAGMLLESRHFLQAESLLKTMIGKSGTPIEAYLMLAELTYEQRRDLNMALAWLDQIPSGGPSMRVLLERAQLLVRDGKDSKALGVVRQAISAFPDASEPVEAEIRLLARLQQKSQALETAQKAVVRWQDNADMLFLLGSLQDESGDKKSAFKTMELLLTLHPDNYQALNYVGYTLAEEGRDLDRALTLLIKADTLAPNQAYIVDSLAWAYFKSGKLEEALREIRRAVKIDDQNDPSIWEHYGDIASRMNLTEEARRAYIKALERKPDNAEALRHRLLQL